MDLIVQTVAGLEEYVSKNKGKVIGPGFILYNQTMKPNQRMIAMFENFTRIKFKTKKSLLENLKRKKINLKGSYAVRCQRIGKHKFSSKSIEKDIGAILKTQKNSVDLTKPKTTIVTHIIDQDCFVSKRIWTKSKTYLVKPHQGSISPVLAASALEFVGYTPAKSLLNPMCKDGVLCIEAALQKGKKIIGLDSEQSIHAARINAKIADVKPEMFVKMSLDWVDTKLDQQKTDIIVSVLPSKSKTKTEYYIDMIYKECLKVCVHALKPKGVIGVLVQKPEQFITLAKRQFMVEKQVDIVIGHQPMTILKLLKQTEKTK
ncbi:hypothetical protein CL622_06315 [archaeon]|nr:hypothetical protein [archaeon]